MSRFKYGQVWETKGGCYYVITGIKAKLDGAPYKRPVIAMSLDSGESWAYYPDGSNDLRPGPFDLHRLHADVVNDQ